MSNHTGSGVPRFQGSGFRFRGSGFGSVSRTQEPGTGTQEPRNPGTPEPKTLYHQYASLRVRCSVVASNRSMRFVFASSAVALALLLLPSTVRVQDATQ